MPPTESGVPYGHVAIVVGAMSASIVFLVGWIRHLYTERTKEQAEQRKEDLALIERVVTINERTTQAIVTLTTEFKMFAARNGGGHV